MSGRRVEIARVLGTDWLCCRYMHAVFVCLCLCLCPSLSLSLSASASVSASASDSETDCVYVPAGACYIDCHKTTVCVCARARASECVCE